MSPRECLLQMNRELREAMDRAREIRDLAEDGKPLDAAKLDRIREIAASVLALKQEFLGLLPDMGGLPFRTIYRQLGFIDQLIQLAENLLKQLDASDRRDRTRAFVEHILRILEGEMTWLREHWPAHDNDGFDSMDRIIETVRRRLEDPNESGTAIADLVAQLKELKMFAAGALPDQLYQRDIGWWYAMLRDLDDGAELIDFFADRVERELNTTTALDLDDFLFTVKVIKLRIEEVVPE